MKKIILSIAAFAMLSSVVAADVVKYDKPKQVQKPISKPNHPLGNK